MELELIRKEAKRLAETDCTLDAACPWPYDGLEGRTFKEAFILHRAARAALGLNDKALTPD